MIAPQQCTRNNLLLFVLLDGTRSFQSSDTRKVNEREIVFQMLLLCVVCRFMVRLCLIVPFWSRDVCTRVPCYSVGCSSSLPLRVRLLLLWVAQVDSCQYVGAIGCCLGGVSSAHSTASPTSLLHTQNGTTGDDRLQSVVMTADEGIVLSGYTTGDFSGTQIGWYDAAVVKLDADGEELWRYQVKHAVLYCAYHSVQPLCIINREV